MLVGQRVCVKAAEDCNSAQNKQEQASIGSDAVCRKEVLTPLRLMEQAEVRRRSDAFAERVEEYRRFFQRTAPFAVPGGADLKLEHVSFKACCASLCMRLLLLGDGDRECSMCSPKAYPQGCQTSTESILVSALHGSRAEQSSHSQSHTRALAGSKLTCKAYCSACNPIPFQ